jgi:hypothetical protein
MNTKKMPVRAARSRTGGRDNFEALFFAERVAGYSLTVTASIILENAVTARQGLVRPPVVTVVFG